MGYECINMWASKAERKKSRASVVSLCNSG